MKQSKGVHESRKKRKTKGGHYREKDPISSSVSSYESSTSSEEGEDRCRKWEGTYCR